MRARWTTRGIAQAMAAVLAATLAPALLIPVAAVADPALPLPATQSVSVTQQGVAPGPVGDETTPRALSGDQPPGGAGPSGSGDFTATSLRPSATWDVSAQTGSFAWSYPLRVPPAPGGQQPSLALSYSSSAVDGLTTTTNNQGSWIGDGWSMWPGYVERSYGSCADDVGGPEDDRPRDLCWRTDNATLSLAGGGSPLIKDASGKWRKKADDGSRIEKITAAGNGDNDAEAWKVTTVDGTQYFFGTRADAKSAWTVPVYGDDAAEPCHAGAFADSWCVQGYRWNLDKVVDRHGNVIHYFYETEQNHYGRNNTSTATPYIRSGWLKRVEYGLRADGGVQPTARVIFSVADRCVPGSDCVLTKPDNLPDVPLDLECDGGTCDEAHAPTFWTTKRLSKITTEVRDGSAYDAVDSWTLRHEFPDPGSGEKAPMWLKGITHTGHMGDGPDITLPEVTFNGARKPNRVTSGDAYSALVRFRMNAIVSESGGTMSITYAEPDCQAGGPMPANPETNTMRCYPVRWTPPASPERTDYFHKYVVAEVSESDRVVGSAAAVTAYDYVGGAAWHYDESELTKPEDKSWTDFRGFGRVVIRKGSGYDGPKTKTEHVYYRGMHGDKLPSGTRTATVTDSEGGSVPDENWLSGRQRESITYDGDTQTVVSKQITEPTWQGPTATRGDLKAYIVHTGVERGFTALKPTGWRKTKIATTYDDRGLPLTVSDLGDLATAADDRCTTTNYVRDTSAWLLHFPSRVQTVAVACGQTAQLPEHAISDTRMSYDGQAPGVAPTKGAVTKSEVASGYPGGSVNWVTAATAAFDTTGRITESADALGNTTTTAFTPTVGGPVTQTVTTNPKGQAVTTTLEPGIGSPLVTIDPNSRKRESTYDALGRLSAAWLADRDRAANKTPSKTFAYVIRQDGPSVVTITAVGPNGNYVSTNELFDGLLRKRQIQKPAAGGGRLLTDYRYDSQGRAVRATAPYYNDSAVDTALSFPNDVDVPSMVVVEYDGAGRQQAEIFKGGGLEKWRTTTLHEGDRAHTTPPEGGTTTTTLVDARGQVTELRQYANRDRTGDYDTTTYEYTPAGQLATMTNSAGTSWTFEYDVRGREVRSVDPDRGTTTSIYDNADRLVSTTDARGLTLVNSYDSLGRKTALHKDSTTGVKLADWTYDTAVRGIGMPAAATRYVGTSAYAVKVAAYNANYQPLRTDVVIPASEGTALAATYSTRSLYNQDGSVASTAYPAIGDIPAETVSHTYDDLGLMKRTYGGFSGQTFEYALNTEHTRYGETQRVHLGEGTKRAWLTYMYDDHTRRLSRSVVSAEVPKPMIADFNYGYDQVGNVTSIANTPRETVADVQCFGYDYLRRLIEAWTPATGCQAERTSAGLGGPAPYWESFTYDQSNNRLTETSHGTAGDTVRTYDYTVPGVKHGLKSVTTVRPDSTQTLEQYTYDQVGNTATRNLDGTTQNLTWDAEGRLTEVTEGDKTTEFLYDADGARLIRRDDQGTTLYLPGQEIRVPAGTTAKNGTRYYGHGGRQIALRDATGLHWTAGDHQGTANIAIHSSSMAVTHRRQTPFGSPRGATAAFPGQKGFVGGTIDPSIGLTTLGARQYDATIGRFISVDPIMVLTDPQSGNGYAYSGHSPVTFSDPSGLTRVDALGDGTPLGNGRVFNGPGPSQGKPEVPGAGQEYKDYGNGVVGTVDTNTGQRWIGNIILPEDIPSVDIVANAMIPLIKADPRGRRDRFNPDVWAIEDGDMNALIRQVCEHVLAAGSCSEEAIFGLWADAVILTGNPFNDNTPFGGAKPAPRPRACSSFIPGTEVLMADGTTRPIEDVKPGDLVLATDPETGESGPRVVTHTITSSGDKDLVDIRAGNPDEVLTATAEHPVWVENRGVWVEARALLVGDELVTPEGDEVPVRGLRARTADMQVYNFTVDGLNTYYVFTGTTPVLVHNAPPGNCSLTTQSDMPVISSKTVYTAKDRSFRIDVENQVPGQPGAGIHLQFMGRGADQTKYYFDPVEKHWVSKGGAVLSAKQAKMVPKSAIAKGFQYLGLKMP